MTMLRFPVETHGWLIETLELSVRANNALRRNSYHTVGDLDGLSVEVLSTLQLVGRTTVDEVVRASERVMARFSNPDDEVAVGVPDTLSFLQEDAEQGWMIPAEFAGSPVAALGLPPKSAMALHDRGITTLEQLHGLTPASAQLKLNLPAGLTQRLTLAMDSLLSLDLEWLQQACRDAHADRFVLPRCGPDVLRLLSQADGVVEELEALLRGLPDRDRYFVLARWCYFEPEQPTLDSLAADAGITRERVRQIVERVEQQFRESGLFLPQTSLLVAALRDAGGVLTTQQFQERVAQQELCDEVGVLRTLPHLARLGLIPGLIFDSDWHLWATGPGEELLVSGKLPNVLGRVSRYLVRQLRIRSCIDVNTLPGRLPFGPEHALKLAVRRLTRVEWVESYGIPVPLTRSKLTNAALKLLAVSQTISLEQAHGALERALGPTVPPSPVLARVLALHPQIVVEEERVRTDGSLDPKTILSPAERTAVALFTAGGNVLLGGNFIDAMVRSGFSIPMANVVLRRPFVRRIGAGIYGLRGRAIHRDTVRARIQERSRERNRNVVKSEQVGDRIIARYRLTRFSRSGVLAQPKQLRDISGVWKSRFSDGTEAPLKIDNGFIWTILPWLKKLEAKEGDFVIASFDRGTEQVEWEYERVTR